MGGNVTGIWLGMVKEARQKVWKKVKDQKEGKWLERRQQVKWKKRVGSGREHDILILRRKGVDQKQGSMVL